MNVQYKSSFERDVKKASTEAQIHLSEIIPILKSATSLADIPNIKKLKAYKTAYRIRVTNYRLGLHYEDGLLILVRFLPRKTIYRLFP
ncbi:MAG: hypothetical protein ABIN95_14260 [Mucilaginibacter sp.]